MPVFCMLLENTLVRISSEATDRGKGGKLKHWMQTRVDNFRQMDQHVSGYLLIGGLIVVSAAVLLTGKVPVRLEEKNFPVQAVEYMRKHPLRGNLFHHYNWGGYLIWHLWPEQKVFIDGRNEVHGLRFLEDHYLELLNAGPSWKTVLKKYNIRQILLPRKEPLIQMIKESGEWENRFEDDRAVLFLAIS